MVAYCESCGAPMIVPDVDGDFVAICYLCFQNELDGEYFSKAGAVRDTTYLAPTFDFDDITRTSKISS